MAIRGLIHNLLARHVSIAPLITFRVIFGLMMFASVLRFWMMGWIETQYIEPGIHFKYFGFHWLPEPSAEGYYALFSLMAISALGIAAGLFYRWSATLFFLSFTYIELIDVTYYLNHYYFVSIVAFLMIFLPAQGSHSLDVKLGRARLHSHVPAWCVHLIMLQLGIVYFYAGLAKLNADWLLEAMPLAIWLPANDHLPIIGPLLGWKATAYAFSWGGAIYDLSIPFLLLWSRTRPMAYAAVVVFHILTWMLFQIGMFPFIMMGATLIFFPSTWHQKWQDKLFGRGSAPSFNSYRIKPALKFALAAFVIIQLAFPFRHVLYSGNPFWHEQGYRFGWRVMLMEKAGYAQFKVKDARGRTIEVQNSDFLTPAQEKMMSTQPDLMIQYAHFLESHYQSLGVETSGVFAEVYVSFNGRQSRPFIDPNHNLAVAKDSWAHKSFILPFEA